MEIGLGYQLDDPALHNRTRNLDDLHFRLLRLGWRQCSIVEARGSVCVFTDQDREDDDADPGEQYA